MGGGVGEPLGHIVPPADDPAPGHDDGADGNLPGDQGGLRFPQRLPHESFVLVFHIAKIVKNTDGWKNVSGSSGIVFVEAQRDYYLCSD